MACVFERMLAFVAVAIACGAVEAQARVYDLLTDMGAIAGDDSVATCNHNTDLMSKTLALMQPGDTLVVPEGTFHMNGGITARNKVGITLQIDGTLSLLKSQKHWPRSGDGKKAKVLEFLEFHNATDLLITSRNTVTGIRGERAGDDGRGLIEGNGATWWGFPGVGYLEVGENRPRLLHIEIGHNVTVENIFFKDSPYWTTTFNGVKDIVVRNSRIEAFRTKKGAHTLDDLTAFNTDGFDFNHHCNNVHVHHCTVYNQDDSFCVKDGTTNVVIEDVDASGLGLTIGSIGGGLKNTVRNVTFRNVYMNHTVKGVYMKFRDQGLVEDVIYENIVMDRPSQYPIWIGPAQQSDSKNICAAHPCSICWPKDPFAKCEMPDQATYKNITLRNIVINNPESNVGVILGNENNPIEGIVFDNVVVNNPSTKPTKWGTGYLCKGVRSGVATGGTNPVPECFNKA